MKDHMFISYCHAEDKIVRELILSLGRLYRVWIDKDSLTGGELFNDAIVEAIKHAECVLVLMSVHYCDSDYCLKEFDCAKDNGGFMIPVQVDEEEDLRKTKYGDKILNYCMPNIHIGWIMPA